MTEGPNVARLRTAVAGAQPHLVAHAHEEWSQCSNLLREVASALQQAAPNIQDQIGETGRRAAEAFTTVSGRVQDRSVQMSAAAAALSSAHVALQAAHDLMRSFADAPLQEPSRPDIAPGSNHPDDVAEQHRYDSDKAAYDAQYADREAKAAAAVQRMDVVYASSTRTMQEVHGQPDPVAQVPADGGRNGGGNGSTPTPSSSTGGYTPGSGGHPYATTTTHAAPAPSSTGTSGSQSTSTTSTTSTAPTTYPPHQPHGSGPGADNGYVPAGPTGDAQSGTPIGGLGPAGPGAGVPIGGSTAGAPAGGLGGSAAGGLAGVIGGGALGGLTGISGAVRGPSAVPLGGTSGVAGSSASSGARPIGATTRSAVSGTLGRGGAVPEEAVGTSGRGAATAGARGASASGGRGTGLGSSTSRRGSSTSSRGSGTRGAAGARGAGGRGAAGASGGGRSRKDPRKSDPDFFLEEQDWVEDEGAAPGVLD
ncbi:hypothetical protein [Nocardioides panaciterrulae]|uniref:PPE family protein n=1 Tax=Nocardioides panaciterrulae TaxID=661492 RepID=A0A7Y9JC60_9ACTN|nr:hypothetical protein [Nocardioides panaciterrulae]NYD43660.1 hypothetical protein [Nocardioides panaciterrulae]